VGGFGLLPDCWPYQRTGRTQTGVATTKIGINMHKLVVIDLTDADTYSFEQYEKQVISLLGKYGARLELGLRSVDGKTETHVLYFPSTASFDSFIADPVRDTLQDAWQLTGAMATVSDVDEISYLS